MDTRTQKKYMYDAKEWQMFVFGTDPYPDWFVAAAAAGEVDAETKDNVTSFYLGPYCIQSGDYMVCSDAGGVHAYSEGVFAKLFKPVRSGFTDAEIKSLTEAWNARMPMNDRRIEASKLRARIKAAQAQEEKDRILLCQVERTIQAWQGDWDKAVVASKARLHVQGNICVATKSEDYTGTEPALIFEYSKPGCSFRA